MRRAENKQHSLGLVHVGAKHQAGLHLDGRARHFGAELLRAEPELDGRQFRLGVGRTAFPERRGCRRCLGPFLAAKRQKDNRQETTCPPIKSHVERVRRTRWSFNLLLTRLERCGRRAAILAAGSAGILARRTPGRQGCRPNRPARRLPYVVGCYGLRSTLQDRFTNNSATPHAVAASLPRTIGRLDKAPRPRQPKSDRRSANCSRNPRVSEVDRPRVDLQKTIPHGHNGRKQTGPPTHESAECEANNKTTERGQKPG